MKLKKVLNIITMVVGLVLLGIFVTGYVKHLLSIELNNWDLKPLFDTVFHLL